MLSDAVLDHATRATLWEGQQAADRTPTGYGLGWEWSELAGHEAVGHGGSHVGATADLWIVPDAELVVAAAANSNARGFRELIASLVEIFVTQAPRAD